MKNKIIKILSVFFIFLISLIIFIISDKPKEYKVIEVIEADEFYIDVNKNNLKEDNELVKLAHVVSFKPIKDYSSLKNSYELGLKLDEYLKAGLVARAFAKEKLLNKNVKVKGLNSCIEGETCYVDLYYENKNYSQELLLNGLGHVNKHALSKNYYNFLNIKETKRISFLMNEFDYVLKNLKTNMVHNLYCEHSKNLSFAELILKNSLNFKTNVFCKKCFEINLNKIISEYKIPTSKRRYSKTISKKFGNIEIFLLNPLENRKPNLKSNNIFVNRLLSEIKNSKYTIDIALYGFGDQREIFEALIEAKKRGVKIRAVSDYSRNLIENYSLNSEFVSEFDAKLDKASSLMHNKFFIFDNKIVLTGSVNISATGSGVYNSNVAAFIDDAKIAKIFIDEFNQMYESNFSNSKIQISDKIINNIEVYFSPKDDIYNKVIMPNLLSAKRTIYISAFYLTDKNMIDDLISLAKRNVEILILLDATSANNFKDIVSKLRNNGIAVIVENWGGKNHEKTILIDDEILILGSCNFSKSGFYKNDENIIVFNNQNIAKFYKDYYLYLFNSIDKKYLVSIPRAEGIESKNSCQDGIDNNFDGKIDSEDDACKTR